MTPPYRALFIGAFASGFLQSAPAHAKNPAVAACLAASDASLALEKDEKLRAERVQLLICAAQNCPVEIRKECIRRVDVVNAHIPTVIFAAKDDAGNDTSAVKITMDGEMLAERLDGTAVAIDPGPHVFTFELEGQPVITKSFVILEAQKDRREVISFARPVAPPPPPEPPRRFGTQRLLALVSLGVGVVGLGVGAGSGAAAISKKSSAEAACPGSSCASQAGSDAWSSAAAFGNVSTASFIVGGLGVVGAAVLWFTAPSASGAKTKTEIGVGPAGVRLWCRF